MNNWETWCDTHLNLICHKFSERVEMTTNLENGIIRIFKDGIEVDNISCNEMLLTEYVQLIERTRNEASKLPLLT